MLPTESALKVTVSALPILTIPTLLASGIAEPAQLAALDQNELPPEPVQATELSCEMVAVPVWPVVME